MISINLFNLFIGCFTGFIVSGQPVCPVCGSTLVTQSGFAGYNRRHNCRVCGSCIRIDQS